MKVCFEADGDVFVDGEVLENGVKTSLFSEGKEYTITCRNQSYKLVVLKSSDIPAVFINTVSGNMNKVHENKEYKEPCQILIMNSNGNAEYDGKLHTLRAVEIIHGSAMTRNHITLSLIKRQTCLKWAKLKDGVLFRIIRITPL